jgi:hypothetical protein
MSEPNFINVEQLEAEMAAGCSVARNLDVSVSTLAHLILAAHVAMTQCPRGSAPWTVLIVFAADATRKGDFPPEMTKMIADSWAGLGLKPHTVQTPGQGGEG